MNARLDLLASANASNSASGYAAACCSRYVAGKDEAPKLFASAAVTLERGAEAVLRFLNRILCCTGYPRA